MPVCKACGGSVIEYDAAAGNGFCTQCGTVAEESSIVSEIVFGETSGGAAMVQGSYVQSGATHARMGGPFGNRGNTDSREQTIANATKKIHNIATVMRLSEVVQLAATRMYTLAVEHKFTRGRKSLNVVAVCLYVACRQKETRTYMLIDFSDLLQVNVFELGHTYLQLVQTLNLHLPLVDPSHYISRFAALLEFGDETHKVASDAVRLVQRFDRDWMTKGRRPAGICGAALLLAARMNNFRRSVEEIVQVVKIGDLTLKKRLDEFRATPSGALTLADFRTVWLEEQVDPPAYTRGLEKEARARLVAEGAVESPKKSKKKSKDGKKKSKRKREEETDEEEKPVPEPEPPRPFIDPALLNTGILAGSTEPLFIPEDDPEPEVDANIDPALRQPLASSSQITLDDLDEPDSTLVANSQSAEDEMADKILNEEVSEILMGAKAAELSSALDDAEQRRLRTIEAVADLADLDDIELDRYVIPRDSPEVRLKERVWVELNKEYLEAIAARGEQQDSGSNSRGNKRRKKTPHVVRDASNPSGSTAAESVGNLLKTNKKYSKRINYDVVDGIFNQLNGKPVLGPDDKDEDHLFAMDDKSDEEMEVIEESGIATPAQAEDAFDDEGSDKGEDLHVNWEDAFEQEI